MIRALIVLVELAAAVAIYLAGVRRGEKLTRAEILARGLVPDEFRASRQLRRAYGRGLAGALARDPKNGRRA